MDDVETLRLMFWVMFVTFVIIICGLAYMVHVCTRTIFRILDKLEEERAKNKKE